MRTCRYCEMKYDDAEKPPRCTAATRSPDRCEGKARGFASLSKGRLSEIAAKGGRCAHLAGTAHKFSHEEAVHAGKVGGNAAHVRRGPQKLFDLQEVIAAGNVPKTQHTDHASPSQAQAQAQRKRAAT